MQYEPNLRDLLGRAPDGRAEDRRPVIRLGL